MTTEERLERLERQQREIIESILEIEREVYKNYMWWTNGRIDEDGTWHRGKWR